jgi:shikimate kinase
MLMVGEEDKLSDASDASSPSGSSEQRRSPADRSAAIPDPSVGNVVLTGFMGTGKTTVGVLLAKRLGFDFIDTDAVIEARYGPIPEIFRTSGETAFRRYEHEVAVECGARTSLVVSTGGRLLLDPANAVSLGRTGSVFCLTATIETILERVMTDSHAPSRPLLAGSSVRERVEALLAERAEGYARFTPVATDGRDPESIVDEIVDLLASNTVDRSAKAVDFKDS